MKYYKGTMRERNGEKEYSQTVFYEAETHQEAYDKHQQQARDWYGDEKGQDEGDGWISFDCGCIYIRASDDLYEISKQTYIEMGNTLSKNPAIEKLCLQNAFSHFISSYIDDNDNEQDIDSALENLQKGIMEDAGIIPWQPFENYSPQELLEEITNLAEHMEMIVEEGIKLAA